MLKNSCRILMMFLIALAGQQLFAQGLILPGDANADGTVNQYDLPFIGYAYGSVGPARADSAGSVGISMVELPWAASFPQGINYAYADASGNGQVGLEDFTLLSLQYNESTVAYGDPLDIPEGVINVDPTFGFPDAELGAGDPGATIVLPVRIEDISQSINLNGLSFSITYPEDVAVSVAWEWNDALLADSASFNFVHQENGRLDIALTRFGKDPLPVDSEIGTFSLIVIEGDLVGLLVAPDDSLEVELEFTDIMLADGDFEFQPVVPQHTKFVLYHPDSQIVHTPNLKALEQTTVFPNPAHETISISSPAPLAWARWYDLTGKPVGTVALDRRSGLHRLFRPAGPGTYILQLWSTEGAFISRRIMFH